MENETGMLLLNKKTDVVYYDRETDCILRSWETGITFGDALDIMFFGVYTMLCLFMVPLHAQLTFSLQIMAEFLISYWLVYFVGAHKWQRKKTGEANLETNDVMT